MGNSSSSGRGHHDETVDYGALVPQGVYTGPKDWNQPIVSQLIVARKLAPFYRPLEDYEESWDEDQILAARKELPDPDSADSVTRIEATASSHRSKRPPSVREPSRADALVYRGAVECPICFLYYPPNINHSRCCDQAICTECFVQIKRAEPTTTHIVSEPAACPYCVQDNFGVVYNPPPWRAGLGSEGSSTLWADPPRSTEPSAPPTHKRRQKSFGADSPEVVTTDQIRPDWEAKLDAVRAAVARRANRRIIMRQVGDRLIPVGVTSGRVHALTPEEAAAAGADANGSRRSRRRQAAQGAPLEQFMGMAGQDLEELMLMEAMRLSLLDHEEHQRKEAEEKKKQDAAAAAGQGSSGAEGASASEAPGPSSPGPSSLAIHSAAPSSSDLISSASSTTPSPRNADSRDSLAPARKSWSLSRSRTPPPPPANPAANVPISEENQAAWRSRAAGPPAFSTLSAALTATSTAAAFLGSAPASRSITPEPRARTPVPSITVGGKQPEAAPVASSSGLSVDIGAARASGSSLFTGGAPLESADLASATSVESGEMGAGVGASYDSLHSSPASRASSLEHERLLDRSTPDSDVSKVGGRPNTAEVAYLEEASR
ncbi:hypothetical protein HYPSUDRAFT_47867 [Hypholoma sublateritium FD-334 SS-4]|uniref:RING-type domain-containing protein n=1 Tax=Hypholoma sublateritium (strain FD-334 SS-4) TaxID=945553 RepID=A0A0D2LYH4_HYPSF|nr:hypothetical protein HYPSUDRAFT_47867 [Hypholoma sublateritium FD-334 SS-4]